MAWGERIATPALVVLIIEENGIGAQSDQGDLQHGWSMFGRAYETRNLLVAARGPMSQFAIVIPKRGLAPEELKTLRERLVQHVGAIVHLKS